jgi:putative transposase
VREIPLVNGEIYHVFNRGVLKRQIFDDAWDYRRFITIAKYYLPSTQPMRLSHFLRLSEDKRQEVLLLHPSSPAHVQVLAYCLMPNHFHLLLRQEIDNGISKYVGLIENAFTRYFNLRHHQSGHILQGKFQAVHVADTEQCLHTSRYIHLNPYTDYITQSVEATFKYPWSSAPAYFEALDGLTDTRLLSEMLDRQKHMAFIADQAEYQRALGMMKHTSGGVAISTPRGWESKRVAEGERDLIE